MVPCVWVEHGFEDVRQTLVVRGGAVKDEGVSDGEFGMKMVVVWLCSRGVGEVAKGSGGDG